MGERGAAIIALPEAGGPELVAVIRAELNDRSGIVPLIAVTDTASRAALTSMNPLGMGGWLPGDDLIACQAETARILAYRLSWLMWEMGVRVGLSTATEDVRLLVMRLAMEAEVSTVIVAASCRPRWRQVLKAVEASAPQEIRLRVAVDTPTTPLQRWAARAGL